MPRYLALAWDKDHLIGVHAQVAKPHVGVLATFELPFPDEIDFSQQPDEAGAWLKSQLDRLDIRARQVLVALPRDEIMFRRLEVPDASNEMLPGLVRYQAEGQSSVPLEQVMLDYVPLPRGTDAGSRAVLMATVARPLIEELRAVVRAADLELVSVGIGSLTALELVAHLERRHGSGTHGTSLLVAQVDRRIEISLMRDRHLLFTHATRRADEGSSQPGPILRELDRALVACQGVQPDTTVDRAWLMGVSAEQAELRGELEQRLPCEVHSINSFDDLDMEVTRADAGGNPAQLAAPLGMLLTRADPLLRETVDFLKPRQPVVRGGHRKLLMVVAAAAAVLALMAAYTAQFFYLRSLDNKIAEKRAEEQQLDERLKRGAPVLQSAVAVDRWMQGNVNWLQPMRAVSDSMPKSERMYLDDWRFHAVAGEPTARMQAGGGAVERRDVERLNQRLADEHGFRVRPNEIESGLSFLDYPIMFEIDADVPATAKPKSKDAQ